MDGMVLIGLCDDEKHIHEAVGKMINEYKKERGCELELIHFFSAKELLESKDEFQILLLDINMPQMDGIEAAFYMGQRGKMCKIIMLTGKRERFKEAFKIGAYRFVTKPIEKEELQEALDDTRESLLGYSQVDLRFGNVSCKSYQYKIDYVQANGDYVKIYVGEKVCESARPLKSWKDELDSRLFIECHKSYLVNLGSIRKVQKDKFILDNGVEIPISRRRIKEALQAFLEYDIRNGRR